MPINTLEFAKITQTQLDRQVVAEATSGWMELNSSRVKYSGGNEVKIPKLSMDGLRKFLFRRGRFCRFARLARCGRYGRLLRFCRFARRGVCLCRIVHNNSTSYNFLYKNMSVLSYHARRIFNLFRYVIPSHPFSQSIGILVL